ncbi:MAG TPA: aminotransferase class III-fold pyridoxal phosphate-dependent enzyme [Desulfotignum sp.]|nr:aminotransferase class III-fold pyridoxal phosphate-dependent enzyme [Desulfotignum sp.]
MKETPRLNISKSLELFEQACTLVPGGVLGARKPTDFINEEYPIFLESGKGCRLTDVDGNEFVDFLCGYGPIILGYREEEVDRAVYDQVRGKGFCFTLTQQFQNRLAEKIHALVPSAEMSVFLKTGSDATTASIRIARAHTGRIKVMRCGYHGWHDWCVEMKGGIPGKFYEDVFEFQYNRLDQLEQLMAEHGSDTAAIIMTPFGHPNHQEMQVPEPGFLEGVKDIARKYGAVLIYDEIRTGFRISMGGAQKYYKVTPDISVLGKAIANGYPISVVTGKKEIMMAAAHKLFISSTFFPNSDAFVAALKTIDILERNQVLEDIWTKGEVFMAKIQQAMDTHDVGAKLTGIPPMFYITFDKDPDGTYKAKRTDFYTQLIRKGFFFTPFHHAYISFRHTRADLDLAMTAIDESLAFLKAKYHE